MGFFGKSDQEKAYEDLINRSKSLSNTVGKQDFNVNNLYSDYKNPYSGDAQFGAMDDYTASLKSDASNMFGRQSAKAGSDTGAMLASQGVGGSLALDAVNKAKSNVNSQKYDYLNRLDTANLGKRGGIMDNMNRLDLRRLSGEQGVENNNMNNLMQQFQMQNNALSQQGNFTQGLDPTNGWDDVMAGLDVAAQFAQAGATAVASDINTKENIKHLGVSKMGFPIITFNYRWNKAKRYIGSIAQAVEKIMPEAVIEKSGIKMVKYALIDVPFYRIGG